MVTNSSSSLNLGRGLDMEFWMKVRSSSLRGQGCGLGQSRTCAPTSRVECPRIGSSCRILSPCMVVCYAKGVQVGFSKQQCGKGQLTQAVEALNRLVQEGSSIDHSVFYGLLKDCIAYKDLVLGREVHALAVKSGFESNAFLANHIISMYASHGKLEEAMQVFTRVAAPDRYMWGSIILAHARSGQPTQAIRLYRRLRDSIVKPDNHIFVAVLKACATAEDLTAGREIYSDILSAGKKTDIFVWNSLLDMYAKCGSLKDAQVLFDSLPTRDVVTWNTMIAGYAQHGFGHEALTLYATMQKEAITPANAVTFACVLQACGRVGALHQGKQLHAEIQKRGLAANLIVGTCVVDMYAKCGCLEEARKVFENLPSRDVVVWNSMIAGYTQHGLSGEALCLYENMQREGIIPADAVTFVCLLQACTSVGALHQGKQLDAQIQEKGLGTNVVVGTSLVDMYAKCGSLENARRVFNSMRTRDVVTWTVMISGYALHGFGQEALTLYAGMQQEGITPCDAVTFVCLMQACGIVAGLEKGKELHAQVRQAGLDTSDLLVANALIDMYGKCGSMIDAQEVFDALSRRDIVTWNALLAGYARHGESELVFQWFHRMREEGIHPDSITFLVVVTGCSHEGLVDEGQVHFEAMSRDYGIRPSIEHYTCMVDLLGRAGQLGRAMEMLKTMPFRPHGHMWRSLLGACQKWGNVELGRHAFECAVQWDKNDAAAYVLMSNIYAAADMQEEAKVIQELRMQVGAWNQVGHSS